MPCAFKKKIAWRGRGTSTKVHHCHKPLLQPLRAMLGRREAPPQPPRRPTPPPSLGSADGGPRAAGICAVRLRRRIHSSPTPTSSAPLEQRRTRDLPPFAPNPTDGLRSSHLSLILGLDLLLELLDSILRICTRYPICMPRTDLVQKHRT